MKPQVIIENVIECLRRAYYMDEAFVHGEEYVKKHSAWIEWEFKRSLKRMTDADWKKHINAYVEAVKGGKNPVKMMLPECEVCPKSGNKLACMLSDCQARELHDYKILKNWYEKWIKDRCCFACANCIDISDNRDTCHVCKLIPSDLEGRYGLVPIKLTCDRFKAIPWEETDIYKVYAKKKDGKNK